jgi:hypothetical protein
MWVNSCAYKMLYESRQLLCISSVCVRKCISSSVKTHRVLYVYLSPINALLSRMVSCHLTAAVRTNATACVNRISYPTFIGDRRLWCTLPQSPPSQLSLTVPMPTHVVASSNDKLQHTINSVPSDYDVDRTYKPTFGKLYGNDFGVHVIVVVRDTLHARLYHNQYWNRLFRQRKAQPWNKRFPGTIATRVCPFWRLASEEFSISHHLYQVDETLGVCICSVVLKRKNMSREGHLYVHIHTHTHTHTQKEKDKNILFQI